MNDGRHPEIALAEARGQTTEAERTLALLRQHQDEMIRTGQTLTRLLREEVERLKQQIDHYKHRISGLEGNLHQLRQEQAALEGELRLGDRLAGEVATQKEQLDQLKEQAAAAQERAAVAEARADGSHLLLENLQQQVVEARRQLEAVREAVVAEQNGLETLRSEMAQLQHEYAELKEQGRPLLPYQPPAVVPRRAMEVVKFGTQLPILDQYALQAYAHSLGMEIKGLVAAAVRNYLPHDAYHQALTRVERETAEASQPLEVMPMERSDRHGGRPARQAVSRA